MKKVIFYGRRNTGMVLLPYLVAKGYSVKVISDDNWVLWMAHNLSLKVVTIEEMGVFDLFICCHGNKIIDKKYLAEGKFVNIHPCLEKYPGHNPIKKYIENGDINGTVESQYLIEQVDAGAVIWKETFITTVAKSYGDFYNSAIPYYFRTLDETLNILNI